MDTSGSYSALRNELRTVETPSLPYLGVYLSDLTFIEDGSKNTIVMTFIC